MLPISAAYWRSEKMEKREVINAMAMAMALTCFDKVALCWKCKADCDKRLQTSTRVIRPAVRVQMQKQLRKSFCRWGMQGLRNLVHFRNELCFGNLDTLVHPKSANIFIHSWMFACERKLSRDEIFHTSPSSPIVVLFFCPKDITFVYCTSFLSSFTFTVCCLFYLFACSSWSYQGTCQVLAS